MKRKARTEIPEEIAALVLYRSDRTCCVCRVPRKPVQIHHMDEDPTNHDVANLAVLCLECHNSTQERGGFGRKLNTAQVQLYREEWHRTVEARRATDSNASPQSLGQPKDERALEHDRRIYLAAADILSEYALVGFLERLWNDDSYLASAAAPVFKYHAFLRAVDNEFVSLPLPERANVLVQALDRLREFLEVHFFSFGNPPGPVDRQYCLHPNWNVDQGGDARYMAVYAGFQEDLGDHVQAVFTAWRDFRRAIKHTLII